MSFGDPEPKSWSGQKEAQLQEIVRRLVILAERRKATRDGSGWIPTRAVQEEGERISARTLAWIGRKLAGTLAVAMLERGWFCGYRKARGFWVIRKGIQKGAGS